jgi:hypothetical protein
MNRITEYVTENEEEKILDALLAADYIKYLLETGKSKKEAAINANISVATLNRRLKKVQDLKLTRKNVVITYAIEELNLPIHLIEFMFDEERFLGTNDNDIIERALELYKTVATEYRKENPGNIKISDYISKE